MYLGRDGELLNQNFLEYIQAFVVVVLKKQTFRKARCSVKLGYLCVDHATSLPPQLWFLCIAYRMCFKIVDLTFQLTITFSRSLYPLNQALLI